MPPIRTMNPDNSNIQETLHQKFPRMRPIKSVPWLATVNGIGLTMAGRRDLDPETGTYVKTHCFSFLFIPLLALGAYRVANAERGWYFLGKESLSGLARGWNWLVLALLMGLIGEAGWQSYTATVRRLVEILERFL